MEPAFRPVDLPGFTFEVDRSQLRLFATATGETRAIYLDPEAARRAGYRDLPAPPTFPFTIGMSPINPLDFVEILGLDLRTVLHGEQSFEYYAPICAGDRVKVSRRLVEVFEKKGGALRFYVVELVYESIATGEVLCRARQTIVSRKAGTGR